MKQAVLLKTDRHFLAQVSPTPVTLTKEDYLFRLSLLTDRMRKRDIDFVLIYGDREHFANMEYFSGYDCRFEEGLFIVPQSGLPTLLVGNEGMSYSNVVPYEIKRVYYRNFSLQGQPRRKDEVLSDILADVGINKKSRVGVCGYKYFSREYIKSDPVYTFDLPQYIMDEIYAVADRDLVTNFTKELTGLSDGIRIRVYSAKEITIAEAAACRSSNVVLNMLKNLKPGITEYELAERSKIGFAPWSMFPLTNFGGDHVKLGLASPSDTRRLALGDVCTLCYGIRGCLTSRAAVASYDQASMGHGLNEMLYSFYGKYFEALGKWYEKLCIGCTGGELHKAVHDIIGSKEFGVTLNSGHYTGMDEWVNSPSYEDSPYVIPDGAYLQADIIASADNPARTAICEDAVIVAGEHLRNQLKIEYPEVYMRIVKRQQMLRNVVGINISDEVLPLSNLNAVMFPFMLNLDTMFGIK